MMSQLIFLQSFIEDLLDLRQLRDGVFSLVLEPLDVSQILKEICSIFDPQAKAKDIRVTYKIVDGLALPEHSTLPREISNENSDNGEEFIIPNLLGDVRRFKQVLINLVKNALKFTTSGSIDIRACYLRNENESNFLVVHIKDTGKGVLLEDIPKLFTRFGKLERTAELNNEGIGLGLTIVEQIVESSGGQIGVES